MLAKRIELQQNIRLVCAFEVQVWGEGTFEARDVM